MDAARYNKLKELAINTHCPLEAYYNEDGMQGVNVDQWQGDRDLARSVCREVGVIQYGGLAIAAFDIDETVYVVYDEPQRTRWEVWEL